MYPGFDVGNKTAAADVAFTLIEKILRLFESQDFSMENFSIDFYSNFSLDEQIAFHTRAYYFNKITSPFYSI